MQRTPRKCPECWPSCITVTLKKLYRPAGALEESSRPGESRPPFEDENIYYYGQYVALVIAETFEQAQDAASHLRVELQCPTPRRPS